MTTFMLQARWKLGCIRKCKPENGGGPSMSEQGRRTVVGETEVPLPDPLVFMPLGDSSASGPLRRGWGESAASFRNTCVLFSRGSLVYLRGALWYAALKFLCYHRSGVSRSAYGVGENTNDASVDSICQSGIRLTKATYHLCTYSRQCRA